MTATRTEEFVREPSSHKSWRVRRSAILPAHIFEDSATYLHVVRNGLAGKDLRVIVQTQEKEPEVRELFIKLLETTSGNLHRYFKRASLSSADTEKILDTLDLFAYAEAVFVERDVAREWMNSPIAALAGEKPIDLSDTFHGRQLVKDALLKIDTGDFS